MEPIVLDCSVVLKWYLDEPGAVEALSLHADDRLALHAPDVLLLEFDAAISANVRHRTLGAAAAPAIRGSVRSAGLVLHSFEGLLDGAFEIALATRKGLCDCLYLALAERVDATLITADRRFAAGLERTSLGGRVRLLAGV